MKTLLGSGAHTNVYLNQDPEYGEVIADIDKLLGELSSGKDTFSHGMERIKKKSDAAVMSAALIKNRQEENTGH